MIDEGVNLSPSTSDSDYLNSSIGSSSVSIERPGIWVWLSDHINKRRQKKDLNDLTSDSKSQSPESIGRSLFYLSSSWNPIALETDLKSTPDDEQSPVDSISNWPGSINSSESILNGEDDVLDSIVIGSRESDSGILNDHSGHFNRYSNDHLEVDQSDKREVKVSTTTFEETLITKEINSPNPISWDTISVNPTNVNLINSNSTTNNVNSANRPSSRPVSIQRHSKRSSNSSNGINCGPNATGTIERQRYEMRRNRLLQELLSTEEDYVRHLGFVTNGYMRLMKNNEPYSVPDDLKGGKGRIVFGNIEAIYEWHRDYMVKEISKCVYQNQPLGPVFKRWLKKLNIYVVYCQNKTKSEYILQQYLNSYFEDLRLHLGHQLRLPDLLIKPIQRIMKYQLILSNLLKYTQQAGLINEINDLRSALKYMQTVPKTTNDMMALTRLAGYEGSVMSQGNLILQGILYVGHQPYTSSSSSPSLSSSFSLPSSSSFSSFLLEDADPSRGNMGSSTTSGHFSSKFLRSISSSSTGGYQFKKRYLFLFEKVMIVCKVPKSNDAFTEYIYKFHLPMNNISGLDHCINSNYSKTKFGLTIDNYLVNGFSSPESSLNGSNNIVFKATSPMEKDKWSTEIQKILDRQSFFIASLISPIESQLSSHIISSNDHSY